MELNYNGENHSKPIQIRRCDVGAKDLIDRQEETALVGSTIRNSEKLFLIGPRRFGKTSILRASEERLTAEGAIVIRLNAESYPTIDMLVQKIVSTAAVRLKGKVETVASQMGRFFSILKPEVKYSVVEQEWSVIVGVNKLESDGSVKLLADALDGLEKLAQEVPSLRPDFKSSACGRISKETTTHYPSSGPSTNRHSNSNPPPLHQ